MADVSPVIIKKTQELLGKYVKKPPLTDKLLKKPPFRFLHDIINVVIQETAYLDGLYTADELNSANITDKDMKMEFLQKLIDVVKLSTNENLKVKPSKIVAGHEPERTNELLQAIGRALNKNIDSKAAVEAVKNGTVPIAKDNQTNKPVLKKQSSINLDKTNRSKTKSDDPTKVQVKKSSEKIAKATENLKTNKSKDEKEKVKKDPKGYNAKTKNVSNANGTTTKELPKKEQKKSIDNEVNGTTSHSGVNLSNGNEDNIQQPDGMGEQILSSTKPPEDEHKIIEQTETEQIKETEIETTINTSSVMVDEPPSKIPSSFSAELVDIIDQEAEIRRKEKLEKKSAQQKKSKTKSSNVEDHEHKTKTVEKNESMPSDKSNEPIENTVSNSMNSLVREKSFVIQQTDGNTTSRPRTSLRPPSVRPASARPGAPRRRDKNVEIILQPDESAKMSGINVKVNSFTEDLDDDGENLVIVEDAIAQHEQIMPDLTKSKIVVDDGNGGQQGHLVQQILETQKELSKMDIHSNEENDKRNESDWDTATMRQRQSSAKQMDTLRDSIQKLTKSINPLGKLMDFLQEDIDSMQMELTLWRNTYKNTNDDLKREQGLSETAVEPLKHHLAQIELSIKEHIELTNTCRANQHERSRHNKHNGSGPNQMFQF